MFFGTLKAARALQFAFLSLTVLFACWRSAIIPVTKQLSISQAGLVWFLRRQRYLSGDGQKCAKRARYALFCQSARRTKSLLSLSRTGRNNPTISISRSGRHIPHVWRSWTESGNLPARRFGHTARQGAVCNTARSQNARHANAAIVRFTPSSVLIDFAAPAD